MTTARKVIIEVNDSTARVLECPDDVTVEIANRNFGTTETRNPFPRHGLYSVLLAYPGGLFADRFGGAHYYFANRIKAETAEGATRFAQAEVLRAQSPENRKGLTAAHFAVVLVLDGHHDAELIG